VVEPVAILHAQHAAEPGLRTNEHGQRNKMKDSITFGPVSSKLLEMREILARPNGWCQGEYHMEGAHCTIGSVLPEEPEPIYTYDWQLVLPAIRREICSDHVADWNDSLPPGREGQLIVCEMLERAALKEARAGR
jgi:hypothetical protein